MGIWVRQWGCGFVGLSIVMIAGLIPEARAEEQLAAYRLPNDVPPVMAVWGWMKDGFKPENYKAHIDMVARHSGANVLATTIRAPGMLVTRQIVHDKFKDAALYARTYGIGVAMDLDVRLARETFAEKYPDELQEMLRLREIDLKAKGQVTLKIPSQRIGDHYTYKSSYDYQSGRLVRVYAYERSEKDIKPETVNDITARCTTTKTPKNAISVTIPCDETTAGKTACVMVAFSHLTPAVFAPHLLPFQRQIIESYRDVPLAGACKDEWGFPPCFDGNPEHNDYWYSHFLAEAYTERTEGRDFVRDCLLMTFGEIGREAQRKAAINHFNEMCRLRNGAIEQDFYDTVKKVFGPKAVVATHPTWWPYPDRREFKKNGLDWWIAKRDYAQTDEGTPYCVRTSLAKKWSSPAWYNMYYSPNVPDYQAEMWAAALTGGRIDYHPLWPVDMNVLPLEERYRALLRGGLMRGDSRVRLLNFITQSPLACPVAVVFGQPCAMNWAGPAYDDVGLKLTNALWQAGYPADLIPSTEIWSGALTVSDDGYVQYGPQRYRSVVLYHPQFDKAITAEFFQKAAKGKSALYRIGDWTRNFEGKAYDESLSLPGEMAEVNDSKSAAELITLQLQATSFAPQPKANRIIAFQNCASAAPPGKGESRLVDGTHIVASGIENAAGDPIQQIIHVNGHEVAFDAIGLFAIRMDKQGQVEALAAGGLKSLKAGQLNIDLSKRVDVALWRNNKGQFKGVLQNCSSDIPASLAKLTDDWLRLAVPVPIE